MPRTPQAAAVRRIAGLKRMPLGLTSAQWAGVPAEVKELGLFSAGVTDGRFLEQIRRVCRDVQEGGMTPERAKGVLREWLSRTGYEPEEGESGTMKDLSSDGRLRVIVDTNCKLASGFGRYAWQAERQKLFPFVELYRAEERKEPRDWPSRWRKAGGRAVRGRFIAPFGDPVWRRISAFKRPYPIFDYNSGMWTRMMTERQAARLGVSVHPGQRPARAARLTDGLSTTATRHMGRSIAAVLARNLPGFRLGADGVLRKQS